MLAEMFSSWPSEQQMQIHSYYQDYKFPMDIRLRFSDWIEKEYRRIMSWWKQNSTSNDTSLQVIAEEMYWGLLREINQDFQHNGQAAGDHLYAFNKRLIQSHFQSDPISLLRVIHNGIELENNIQRQLQNAKPDPNSFPTLENLLQEIQSICNASKNIIFDWRQTQLNPSEIYENNIALESIIVNEIMENYQQFYRYISDELYQWRNSQRKLFTDKENEHHRDLYTIQNSMETLYNLLLKAKEFVLQIDLQFNAVYNCDQILIEKLRHFSDFLSELEFSLVATSFIVYIQPWRVIKNENKFETAAIFLLGHKLNIPQIHVDATIVRYEELKLRTSATSNPFSHGCDTLQSTITNRKNPFNNGKEATRSMTVSCQHDTNRIIAHFREWKCPKFDKSPTNNNENYNGREKLVAERKSIIEFDLQYTLDGKSIQHHIRSEPIIIISNSSQSAAAWGTILWDSYFSELNRSNLEAPEDVSWEDFFAMLNIEFIKRTDRGLTKENELCLKEIFFSVNGGIVNMDSSKLRATRKDFNLTKHSGSKPDHPHTFWQWLDEIFDLLKDNKSSLHIRSLWRRGYIVGFITRNRAMQQINSQHPGTFLIRFSAKMLGAISFCYADENGQAQLPQPNHPDKLSTHDRPLAEMINSTNKLQWYHCHPNQVSTLEVAQICRTDYPNIALQVPSIVDYGPPMPIGSDAPRNLTIFN